MTKKPFNLSLPEELIKETKDYCYYKGMSASDLVAMLLSDYLDSVTYKKFIVERNDDSDCPE